MRRHGCAVLLAAMPAIGVTACGDEPAAWDRSVRAVATPAPPGPSWPAAQLLPSFPAPAPVQDLITLRGQPQRWEAEGGALSHRTGRLETDGWLCQVGIDAPNLHMIYGPYDATVPAGPNEADFRIKTDVN